MAAAKIGGLNVYHELSGEGLPVLFISGITLDHAIWKPFQVPAFVAAGYRCLLFDNRDAGRTGESPTGPYPIGRFVDDTIGLLDHVGIGPAHVVGYSMGGMIAQELALRAPGRLRSLTLVATIPKCDGHEALLVESLKSAKRHFTPEEFSKTLGLRAFTHRFFNNPDAVKAWMGKVLANPYPQSIAAFLRQADAVIGHDALDRLHGVSVPTHVVVGDEDELTAPRHSRLLAERIPGARLTTIPGVGHGLPVEKAPEFNKAVLEFLALH